MKVRLIYETTVNIKIFLQLNIDITFNEYIAILDLPPDTPLLDLHKMAATDMAKLPHMDKSGERCIRAVQEWMLAERSSSECAVLAEDTLQRILVGVIIFF